MKVQNRVKETIQIFFSNGTVFQTKSYIDPLQVTRDLFKKIRDTKGTFHAQMDSIKDRNGMGWNITMNEVKGKGYKDDQEMKAP